METTTTIYNGITITCENGYYKFTLNGVLHTNTNIHMAKRMITRDLIMKKTKKANQISLSNFNLSFAGYGHYRVTYTSPVTGKSWTKVINDMTIIDEIKSADYPKIKTLHHLKNIVKW